MTDWVKAFLDIEEDARRDRMVRKAARLIYPTPFGEVGEKDLKGYRYPKYPLHTSGWFATRLIDGIFSGELS